MTALTSLVETRHRTRGLRLMVAVAGALIVTANSFQVPPAAEGHCPGGPIHYEWATASKGVSGNSGAYGLIQFTNPTVCISTSSGVGSLEWVTDCDGLCNAGQDGWAQVGWRKEIGWIQPKGYCEFAAGDLGTGFGQPPDNKTLFLNSGTYYYEVVRSGTTWYCYINNQLVWQRSTTWMGFSYGDIILAGGEAQSTHTQIGLNAPSKLLLSDIRALSIGWSIVDLVCCDSTAFPYGKDEPAPGQIRNWTVSH